MVQPWVGEAVLAAAAPEDGDREGGITAPLAEGQM